MVHNIAPCEQYKWTACIRMIADNPRQRPPSNIGKRYVLSFEIINPFRYVFQWTRIQAIFIVGSRRGSVRPGLLLFASAKVPLATRGSILHDHHRVFAGVHRSLKLVSSLEFSHLDVTEYLIHMTLLAASLEASTDKRQRANFHY